MVGERTIDAGTPASREMAENVRRAVARTERLNAIPYDDRERIAAAWGELTGHRRAPGERGHVTPSLRENTGSPTCALTA